MWNREDASCEVVNEGACFREEDNEQLVNKLEQERCHLTDNRRYFPQLVWEKVMERMQSKEDVENCFNASPFFGTLLSLREKRLRQVFGILGRRFADEKNEDDSYKETNMGTIPWSRPADKKEAHRLTGILKCRLVSKSWNGAIEKVFEDKQFAGRHLLNLRLHTFDCNAWPRIFLKHFHRSHSMTTGRYAGPGSGRQGEAQPLKNPFLGHRIKLDYDETLNDQLTQSFHNECLKLAEQYGQGIWYLTIWYFGRDTRKLDQLYRKFIEILQLTPNLIGLRIVSNNKFTTLPQVTTLEQELTNNPFPRLTKLKYMKMECVVAVMLREIVQENLHVTQLKVERGVTRRSYYPVLIGPFPNLHQLSIDISSLEDFEEFESYPFPLNLTKFQMHFAKTIPFFFLPWSRVFRAVESRLNRELCTHLDLCLPKPGNDTENELVWRESLNYRLNFPNLHTFAIRNEMPFCLDFILPSKNSLSQVQVSDWKDVGKDYERFKREQVIKFLGYSDNIQDSNIRGELPRLKNLTVGSRFRYTCYEFGTDGEVKIINGGRPYNISVIHLGG